MATSFPRPVAPERLRAHFVRGGRKIAYDLRLLMGRHWLKSISGIGNHAKAFRDAYPILPPNPKSTADAAICAHPASFAMLSALAGRAMDGGARGTADRVCCRNDSSRSDARNSVKSRDRAHSSWIAVLCTSIPCEIAQRAQARKKEIGAAAHRDELRQSRHAAP
jgi:hypothetical protein